MTPPRPPKRSNKFVAGAFLGVAILASLFPLWYTKNKKIDHDKPLIGEAAVRGAYMNAGSRDIGPDPNYKPAGRYQPPN